MSRVQSTVESRGGDRSIESRLATVCGCVFFLNFATIKLIEGRPLLQNTARLLLFY